MKNIYYYIKESLLDDEDDVFDGAKEGVIKDFLETNYKINSSYNIKEKGNEFIVDVRGSVKVMNKNITTLTEGLFKFGEVGGSFDCIGCKSLKSLKGAPKETVVFDCSNCKSLTSLEGAPKCTFIAAYNCGKSYGKSDIIKYTEATYKMTNSGSQAKLN